MERGLAGAGSSGKVLLFPSMHTAEGALSLVQQNVSMFLLVSLSFCSVKLLNSQAGRRLTGKKGEGAAAAVVFCFFAGGRRSSCRTRVTRRYTGASYRCFICVLGVCFGFNRCETKIWRRGQGAI